MVPIGHPGAPHPMHGGPHSVQSIPNTPSGPNTLSTMQSNKASSAVVSAITFVFTPYSRAKQIFVNYFVLDLI